MKKSILLVSVIALVLALVLCACGGTTPTTPSSTSESTTESSSKSTSSTQATQTKVTLYADFSAGSADAESMELIKSNEQTVSGDLTVEVLAQQLSEWTGLDFTITSAELSGDSVTVDWAANATLVAGLDERGQKEEFHFYDAESLNWFMMDSLARTIKENLKVSTVYYSMDGGKPIALEDMTGLKELPVEQPYEGSAFFFAHVDNKGDDEVGQFTYRDEENQLLLSYPNDFSADAAVDENGDISFASQQGDSALSYWVIPNTYDEDAAAFIENSRAKEIEKLQGNVVIGKSETLNQETGEVSILANYWVVDTDRIVCVAIKCGSWEEVSQWYDSFKGGAVHIESVAGINAGEGISEDEAMDVLSNALADRMTDETAIVANGESEMEGQHCWTFSFGKNTPEKFTAEEHYAVTDNGEIYVLDIINDKYEPLAIG
ncbi:hypothetical protein ACS3UN_11985 [Oscillospiraceae bacterium LTW-04]|nr:hypothetical protein RBH76_13725 [Oscillospiraceae bacterium MB24-C1]